MIIKKSLIFLFFIITFYSLLAQQSKEDCGLFLFRVEYYMYPFGEHYVFEVRNECEGDSLFFESNWLNWTLTKPEKVEVQISRKEFRKFQKLVEGIEKNNWNDCDNPYLLDGLTIGYSYIDKKGDLIRNEMILPSSDETIHEELMVFKALSDLGKKKFEPEILEQFQRYVKYYYIGQ